jgi:hypothetical protein
MPLCEVTARCRKGAGEVCRGDVEVSARLIGEAEVTSERSLACGGWSSRPWYGSSRLTWTVGQNFVCHFRR